MKSASIKEIMIAALKFKHFYMHKLPFEKCYIKDCSERCVGRIVVAERNWYLCNDHYLDIEMRIGGL